MARLGANPGPNLAGSKDGVIGLALKTQYGDTVQPDAYSVGTKLYYKLMQTVFWLQQLQQLDSIPDFRHQNQTVNKQEVIDLH